MNDNFKSSLVEGILSRHLKRLRAHMHMLADFFVLFFFFKKNIQHATLLRMGITFFFNFHKRKYYEQRPFPRRPIVAISFYFFSSKGISPVVAQNWLGKRKKTSKHVTNLPFKKFKKKKKFPFGHRKKRNY